MVNEFINRFVRSLSDGDLTDLSVAVYQEQQTRIRTRLEDEDHHVISCDVHSDCHKMIPKETVK